MWVTLAIFGCPLEIEKLESQVIEGLGTNKTSGPK
jgi:hypothetical protein